jgi:hypothetical protein
MMVPLEYGSSARSVAGSMDTRGAGSRPASSSVKVVVPAGAGPSTTICGPCSVRSTAACADGRNGAAASRNRAPESASWPAISSGVQSGLIPVTTPPAAIAP